MKKLSFAIALLAIALPAGAQQATQHPTADQVTVQILENEARNYRATIGQLAVQVNDLNAQVAAVKAKCGKLCEPEPAK